MTSFSIKEHFEASKRSFLRTTERQDEEGGRVGGRIRENVTVMTYRGE